MLELLAAAQAERKAKLDAGRVDTVFKEGDRVLLRTKELLDAADIGKLRPRWDSPFAVTACPGPNAYTLALQHRMRCSPTVNVDRLKPFFEQAGTAPAPGAGTLPGEGAGVRRHCLTARLTPLRGPPGLSCGGSGCGAARPSGPGASTPRRRPGVTRMRATRWFPARCLVGRPGGDGPRRSDGSLPLAYGWLGPLYRGCLQPGCLVFARGADRAVRQHIRPRVGDGALAARRGLTRPGQPMGAPPSRCAIVSLASL